MKLIVLCHLMNTYNWLTQNLLGGLRRSREVLEPEERSLVLQVLLNLFRNVISSYLYNCQKNNQINKSSFVSLVDSVVKTCSILWIVIIEYKSVWQKNSSFTAKKIHQRNLTSAPREFSNFSVKFEFFPWCLRQISNPTSPQRDVCYITCGRIFRRKKIISNSLIIG